MAIKPTFPEPPLCLQYVIEPEKPKFKVPKEAVKV